MRQLETSKPIVRKNKNINVSARRGPSQSQIETTYYTTVMSSTSNQKVVTIFTILWNLSLTFYTDVHIQITHERNEMQALTLDIIRYQTGNLKEPTT